jgi:pimeloyl-ACP methyl ester carboxylesterase/DNA-binding CsgD family transcriptional regulator
MAITLRMEPGSGIGATAQFAETHRRFYGGYHSLQGAKRVESRRMNVLTKSVGQAIRFCTSADGVQIAYATHGQGPPLVRAGTWMTHLEFDWDSPLWRHWLTELGRDFKVIRYDIRGSGLSDRHVEDFSLEAWVSDLEAVVDAAGLDRFVLLGVSGGGPIAITYATRHPERVSHLILYGTYARARRARNDPAAIELEDALVRLIKVGWGGANPAFRRVFTTLFVPDATSEQMTWFDEIQQRSTSAENAVAMRRARSEIDVSATARDVGVPTLTLHASDDAVVPFQEGRRLAGLIKSSQFVPLDGRNHILLEHESAWNEFLINVRSFAAVSAGKVRSADYDLSPLSDRELDVLRLVSGGRSNIEIAEELFLSERTVERHLSNIYTKLGISGKAARAAAAAAFSARRHSADSSRWQTQ